MSSKVYPAKNNFNLLVLYSGIWNFGTCLTFDITP